MINVYFVLTMQMKCVDIGKVHKLTSKANDIERDSERK